MPIAGREHVHDAAALQPGAELAVLAVGLVRGDPPGGQSTLERPGQHRQALGGFGRERHLFVDAGLTPAAARRRTNAAAGKVPGPPALAPRAGVGEEHTVVVGEMFGDVGA
jgi:hypothetical protein